MIGTPEPNAWKRSNLPVLSIVVVAIAVVAVCVGGVFLWQNRPFAAPVVATPTVKESLTVPPSIKITHTTSEGGSDKARSEGRGGAISGDGDKINLKDFNQTVPSAGLTDTGNATGGGQSGSISAAVSGLGWVRLLGILGALACAGLAYLNFRKNPLDWHHTAALAGGSLGCILIAANPDLLIMGAIVGGAALLLKGLPSKQATATLDAAQWYDDFVESDPQIKAAWIAFRAKMPAKSKSVIDTFIKPSNT